MVDPRQKETKGLVINLLCCLNKIQGISPDLTRFITEYYLTFIRKDRLINILTIKKNYLSEEYKLYIHRLHYKEINERHGDIDYELKSHKPFGSGKNGALLKQDKINDIIYYEELHEYNKAKYTCINDILKFYDKEKNKYMTRSQFETKMTEKQMKRNEELKEWFLSAPEWYKERFESITYHIDKTYILHNAGHHINESQINQRTGGDIIDKGFSYAKRTNKYDKIKQFIKGPQHIHPSYNR